MTDERLSIRVGDQHISGTLHTPERLVPGVLFVHGWGGNQEQDLASACEIARLGCLCLTFDMRGHAETEQQHETVTREDNLRDVLAAYDALTSNPAVDRSAIAVIGSSYGGYLAAILTELREVRWLALRVPALYRDRDWGMPKMQLDKRELAAYRRSQVDVEENRALRACAAFKGDALIVESEHDEIVPHPAVASYIAAFRCAHSLTYRVIDGADHALSHGPCRKAYRSLLVNWTTEMILAAREPDHG